MEDAARTSSEIMRSIRRAHERRCAADAELLDLIGRLDEAEPWPDEYECSLAGWLSAEFGVTSGTAYEWTRMARGLRSLPAIRAAHAAGRLSDDKIRALTKFVTAEGDVAWAERAPGMTAAKLYREAARHLRARRDDFEEDRQQRYLRTRWDDDGRFVYLDGCLPSEQGAPVVRALESRAQEVVLEDDGPLYDRQGARMADALEELVCSSGDRRTPPTLVIHADAEVIAGRPRSGAVHLAETEDGTQLSDEAIRRLACDARIEWVIERDGEPVGIGRQGRTPPGWLLRLVRHRDVTCRAPGCDRRRWLDAHHIRHWADGGPTDVDNLVLLFSAHHRRIHEGRFVVRGRPSRRVHDPGAFVTRERAAPAALG